jgi:hypothetical protein
MQGTSKKVQKTGIFGRRIKRLNKDFGSTGRGYFISRIKWDCFEKANPLRKPITRKKRHMKAERMDTCMYYYLKSLRCPQKISKKGNYTIHAFKFHALYHR